MANILFGVTGSVAAIKTPLLYEQLRRLGHQVKIVSTHAALYFFDPAALDPSRPERNPELVILDEDEWPGQRYQREDKVLHIELRRWADLFLIAPLDANTLAKLANGLADNCLTCVWRAWEPANPVVLAPAMNTLMWLHPATARHLRQLAADAGASPPSDVPFDALLDWINSHCPRLRVAPPESRRLACDDVGVGAIASLDAISAAVESLLSSPRIV
jgi:phosphopantothenoylcysteine decarboxylase